MSAKKSKTRKGRGRPKAEVSGALVVKLAGIGCTVAEIAYACGVSKDTLERNFAAYIEKGREGMKISLRRKQWAVAMKGSVGMLIWLGKQTLEQRDRHEIVDLTDPFKRMTPAEMKTYAETGGLPAWFPKASRA